LKVLVCGGRNYYLMRELFAELDRLHADKPITHVIHGDQRGADRLAGKWAKRRGVPCTPVPARWQQFGTAAGPIRNDEMLAMRPDLVVAFSGSYGTAGMVRKALKAGVPVVDLRRFCRTKKKRYQSRDEAQETMRSILARRTAAGHVEHVENGIYLCEFCGGWHLTSKFKDNAASVDLQAPSV
jgi:hypothetical protein